MSKFTMRGVFKRHKEREKSQARECPICAQTKGAAVCHCGFGNKIFGGDLHKVE